MALRLSNEQAHQKHRVLERNGCLPDIRPHHEALRPKSVRCYPETARLVAVHSVFHRISGFGDFCRRGRFVRSSNGSTHYWFQSRCRRLWTRGLTKKWYSTNLV